MNRIRKKPAGLTGQHAGVMMADGGAGNLMATRSIVRTTIPSGPGKAPPPKVAPQPVATETPTAPDAGVMRERATRTTQTTSTYTPNKPTQYEDDEDGNK
jgi:hypothetical protein